MRLRSIIWAVIIIMLPALASAAQALKISMLPNYSADVINTEIHPLSEYLMEKTGFPFEVDLSADFYLYEKKLKSGAVAVGYENPAMYLKVSDAHQVLAMAVMGNGVDQSRGLIITKKDTGIEKLSDLKGKRVSIVGYTSGYGYLSQKITLKEEGINPDKDMNLVEAVDNKSENVILSVYTGDADAGFVHETALKEAKKYIPISSLRVIKACAWLPNWALSVDRRLPDQVKKKIQAALLELPEGHQALKALNIKSFRYAEDGDYDRIREDVGSPDPNL